MTLTQHGHYFITFAINVSFIDLNKCQGIPVILSEILKLILTDSSSKNASSDSELKIKTFILNVLRILCKIRLDKCYLITFYFERPCGSNKCKKT